MPDGEVTVGVRAIRKRRIWISILAAATLLIALYAADGWWNGFEEIRRSRIMSQMVGAVVYQADTGKAELDSAAFAQLTKTYGATAMDRIAWIDNGAEATADDIVLIERPDNIGGKWRFAIFGDSHVKKMSREAAAEIIRRAGPRAKSISSMLNSPNGGRSSIAP